MAYHFMWGQKQSAMLAEVMLLNFALKNDEFSITKKVNDVLREHDAGFLHIYFSDASIKNGYANGVEYLTPKSTAKVLDRIELVQKNFKQFVKKINKTKLKKLSDSELLILFKEYMENLLFLQKIFRASDPSATTLIENKVKRAVTKKYKKLNLEIFAKLITPVELDKTQEEVIDWYELCRKKKITNTDLKKHILKYPANFANSWSYDEIIMHLKDRLRNENTDKLDYDIEQFQESKKELIKAQTKLFKGYSQQIVQYCKLIQFLSRSRFEVKHCWSGAETLCLDFLHEIARRININFDRFIFSYNFSDIINYFENGIKLTNRQIKDRLSYSILHYNNGQLLYLYGREAKKYFAKKYTFEKTTSVSGNIANYGIVKGKAKIVLVDNIHKLSEDSNAFKHGEILITTMTSPAMIHLASKASAIVTNEGGICSHAAIIARELKIPCIVGTKNATKVFEDGDTIEVDAEEGIVKKVSK